MNIVPKFIRDERGNVFGYLGVMALVCVLLAGLFIKVSSPDLTQVVESVTVGKALVYGADGYADGISVPEKPAQVFLIGEKQ